MPRTARQRYSTDHYHHVNVVACVQWGLVMGMEHERIHLETSSVLLRQLPVHLLSAPDGWAYAPLKAGQYLCHAFEMVPSKPMNQQE